MKDDFTHEMRESVGILRPSLGKKTRSIKQYLPHSVAASFAFGFASWLWIGFLETFKVETLFITWFGWFLSMLLVVPAVLSDDFSSSQTDGVF